ncbi:MAG: hypothetical protein IRY99_04270 [Isosphaeraceae bacterium]|nr:hypothetical protein [Isosphaeraceae bacterium]
MADEALKRKIYDLLRHGYFKDPDDYVYVSDGMGDNVHVVLVSPKLEGRRSKERDDLIWSELLKGLQPEEWGRVSLSIGYSPEELKALV